MACRSAAYTPSCAGRTEPEGRAIAEQTGIPTSSPSARAGVGEPRQRRSARLPATEGRSLITVAAAAGWGKSTFAADLTAGRRTGWLRLTDAHRDPSHLAAELAALGSVAGEGVDDLAPEATAIRDRWVHADVEVVVLDDAHLIDEDAFALVRDLAAPIDPGPQLIVLSRTDLGLVDAQLRATSQVLEIDARQLALELDEVDALVAAELVQDRALAARMLDATGGWPALIRLLIAAMRHLDPSERSAAVDGAIAPNGPVGSYLRTVVLPGEEQEAHRVLVRVALLGSAFEPLLARALPDPELLSDLVARGLVRDDPIAPQRLRLAPALQRLVDEHVLPKVDPDAQLVDELFAALRDEPDIPRAVSLLARRGRSTEVARLLEDHGRDLLRAGHLRVIDQAGGSLDEADRTPAIDRLHAEALAYLGDWVHALDRLAASGVPAEGPLAPQLALESGLIHHVRGDLASALTTYRRGFTDEDDATQDDPAVAALHAWYATACWLRGELDESRAAADRAMRAASVQRDDAALALAHTAAALLAASDGDRHANEDHYRQALHAAQRAGDRLQEARIRTNWGSHHLEEGNYADAQEQTEVAIDLAERSGFAMISGIAHCNRAEILVRTGNLDQAIADAERGREILAAIGARTEAYAHHLLGAARTERGELTLAQQAYERALRIATPAGDRQALVPAHIGLATVLAGTDLDAATEAALQALELDGGMLRPEAHLAMAWVAAAGGQEGACREHALRAREEATARDNRVALAEAATCLALLASDPVPALREARLLWEQLDTPLWTTRIDLGIARRSGDPQERARIDWLERRLSGWGCPPDRGSVAHRLLVNVTTAPRTTIRALGSFAAEREGRPLTPAEWGSRKAQDLVKILVVRSGRGITREEIAHLLWPDQAYEEVSNRLSVALSLARSALSGDGDTTPIVSQGATLRLDTDVIEVDLMAFTELAEEGLRARRNGEPDVALPLLLRAEELYGGDLLEDDPDAPGLTDRRLAVRTSYLEVARSIARLARADDPDLEIRMLLRVLDRDGYDEPAHLNLCLALLRSGRHGEARRRFHVYEHRMQELDLPVVPFHELTREAEDDAERAAS